MARTQEDDVLADTSICRVVRRAEGVEVELGTLSLRLNPTQLAALAGSLRGSCQRLFTDAPRPLRSPSERPWLRLVQLDERSESSAPRASRSPDERSPGERSPDERSPPDESDAPSER